MISLSRKLVTYILLVSSGVTAVITLTQVAFDYRTEIGEVERSLHLIEAGYLQSLSRSVWDMNNPATQVQTTGIQSTPHIRYVEVRDGTRLIASAGVPPLPSQRHIEKTFDLRYGRPGAEQKLGSLLIEADIEYVYLRLYKKIVLIFLGQLFKTLLVSSLIYFGIRQLFTRHIIAIAAYLKDFDPRKVSEALTLQRKPTSQDEFDVLVSSINQMRTNLLTSYTEADSQRTAAQRANASKSLFLANISHELRTPMHGILSYATFGRSKIATAPKEKLKTYFDEIHDSGTRLLSLLNDLLDLSKLEAGKVTYVFNRSDLSQIANSVCTEMRAFAAEKRVLLKMTDEGKACSGCFDSEKIGRVIRNLVSNAIKFSRQDTAVTITVASSEDQLKCTVSNLGVGIPESEMESIFDKFIQSSRTSTGSGGTGLGLAICKEIVQQHQGRIWAENEVSQGKTRFIFTLPQGPEQKST